MSKQHKVKCIMSLHFTQFLILFVYIIGTGDNNLCYIDFSWGYVQNLEQGNSTIWLPRDLVARFQNDFSRNNKYRCGQKSAIKVKLCFKSHNYTDSPNRVQVWPIYYISKQTDVSTLVTLRHKTQTYCATVGSKDSWSLTYTGSEIQLYMSAYPHSCPTSLTIYRRKWGYWENQPSGGKTHVPATAFSFHCGFTQRDPQEMDQSSNFQMVSSGEYPGKSEV